MTRSPFSRLRALAVASVVSLALLASGCAQGGSNEASTGGASAPATQAAGAALVIITHDPRTAAYADREAIVRDGRLSTGTGLVEEAR